MTSRGKLWIDLARNRYLYGRDTAPVSLWAAAQIVDDDFLSDEDDDSGEEFIENPNLYAGREDESDYEASAADNITNDDGLLMNVYTNPVSSCMADSNKDDGLSYIIGKDR